MQTLKKIWTWLLVATGHKSRCCEAWTYHDEGRRGVYCQGCGRRVAAG